MNFFTRLSNGWNLAMNSFTVLKENRQLIIFPILSGISMLLVISSFLVAAFAAAGWNFESFRDTDTQNVMNYIILFFYYLVNYFVIVFFNMALVHCTHLYFMGEEVTIRKGLQFSMSRIGVIFAWAVFAATVGTLLRLLQDNLGRIGKFVISLIGIVWSVATFFVVPVIAYEKLGPLDAFKRSTTLMKEKWGESLSARFSFGLVQIVFFLGAAFVCFLLGLISPILGIILFVLTAFAILVIMSAAKMIFISAVYHNINGDPIKHFNQQLADNLFEHK
ncbi:MAG TPA: DUF6159 family protein [Puia sp.]